MKIVVITKLTTLSETIDRSFEVEEQIVQFSPTLAIANIAAWSIFKPTNKEISTVYETIAAGYLALSKTDLFKAYDVYIGPIYREEFDFVDLIIFENEISKLVFLERFGGMEVLPKAREIITLDNKDEVGSEIYKRAIIRNYGA